MTEKNNPGKSSKDSQPRKSGGFKMSKKMPQKAPYPHFGTSRGEPIPAKLYTAKELDALLRKHATKMKRAAAKESGLNEEGSS